MEKINDGLGTFEKKYAYTLCRTHQWLKDIVFSTFLNLSKSKIFLI